MTYRNYNLQAAIRELIEAALAEAGSIVEAAKLMGITRHSLKRRIVKHGIRWTTKPGRPTGSRMVDCAQCSGSGVVTSLPNSRKLTSTCDRCDGTGRVLEVPRG